MRVTLLSKALVVGAYQRKCELIAAHEDIELTVLAPPAWGNQRLEHAHTQGYALREIPIRFNGNFHLHHYPTLAGELQRSRPDVLHIDEEPYNVATWLALRASRSQKNIFFTWQNILRSYPPPFRWMERDVLRKADAAVAGSEEAQRVWIEKGFAKTMAVIPQFGVDEHSFFPHPQPPTGTFRLPPEGRGIRVGFAGRLVHEKGADLLLRAIAQVPEAKAIIAGDGPEENALRQLAAQLNIAERVAWRGAMRSTEMPAFYHECDALAVPSRTLPHWKEQFGRVIIEAMACGVVVMGARCGEIPNLIGDAGLLFDEEDADALAAHIRGLIEQPARHDALAKTGRARVLQRFTMKRIADQTVDFYRALTCV
jgi:glycosyltransferase involved in cell wall biosynthesis